jgi:hypothetical protein
MEAEEESAVYNFTAHLLGLLGYEVDRFTWPQKDIPSCARSKHMPKPVSLWLTETMGSSRDAGG